MKKWRELEREDVVKVRRPFRVLAFMFMLAGIFCIIAIPFAISLEGFSILSLVLLAIFVSSTWFAGYVSITGYPPKSFLFLSDKAPESN